MHLCSYLVLLKYYETGATSSSQRDLEEAVQLVQGHMASRWQSRDWLSRFLGSQGQLVALYPPWLPSPRQDHKADQIPPVTAEQSFYHCFQERKANSQPPNPQGSCSRTENFTCVTKTPITFNAVIPGGSVSARRPDNKPRNHPCYCTQEVRAVVPRHQILKKLKVSEGWEVPRGVAAASPNACHHRDLL